MVTLSKRATPSQKRILRAVEGAVKNAADGHQWPWYTPRVGRSIAKRAAGTLTAQWPDVLAVSSAPKNGTPSERSVGSDPLAPTTAVEGLACRPRAKLVKPHGRGTSNQPRRSPLRFLHNSIGAMAKMARVMGQTEREAACVEILKMIAELEKRYE